MRMKSILKVGLVTALFFGISGCGSEVVDTLDSSSYDASSAAALGAFTNPIPFGEEAKIKESLYDEDYETHKGTIKVTLAEVLRGEEAWNLLYTASEYNQGAPEGHEWVVVKAKITLTDTDDKSLTYRVYDSFIPYDATGGRIHQQDLYAENPEPQLDGNIAKGQTIEGYFSFIAQPEQSIILEYKGNSSVTYFALA